MSKQKLVPSTIASREETRLNTCYLALIKFSQRHKKVPRGREISSREKSTLQNKPMSNKTNKTKINLPLVTAILIVVFIVVFVNFINLSIDMFFKQ